MANLPIYKNFDEKSKFFNIQTIDNSNHLDNLLKLFSYEYSIFRGISSSKYKIFTSLQRYIIENGLEGKFGERRYIDNFRTHPLLSKYFKALRIEPSTLSIFSLLQHFESPSKFVDFTFNFEKALFFATEKFDENSFTPDGTINDYFSLYSIKEANLDLLEIPAVLEGVNRYKKLTEDLVTSYEDYNRDELIKHVDLIFSTRTLKIFLLKHYEDLFELFNINNNYRIVAQEGLFIFNGYEAKPLEEALKEFFIEATIYQASELDDASHPDIIAQNKEYMNTIEENKEKQKRLKANIIDSFEIHKSLIPQIQSLLKFTRDDIYPDPIKICKDIFSNSL